ncbi:hypothetical protein D9M69_624260 [compost metagenome]
MQHDGAVAIVERLTHGMRDHECCQLVFGNQCAGQFHDEFSHARIKGCCMLIKQQHF